jgi:hypothetical protein
MLDNLKIIAATAPIIGIISGFLERWYAPDTLVTEQSPHYPKFLKWIGWLLASLGAIAYIVIDYFEKM